MIYKSKEVIIRPLEKSDLNMDYQEWMYDPVATQFNSHGNFPMDLEDVTKFLDSIKFKQKIVWSIFFKDIYIGNAALQDFNWIDRNCEVAIFIGDKNYWGKGIGKIVIEMLLMHGFKLNLHKIYLGTAESNKGMIKIAKNLGMLLEGKLREHVFLDGGYQNVLRYGILNEEENI